MPLIQLGPIPHQFVGDYETYRWFQDLKGLVLAAGGLDPSQIDETGIPHNNLSGVDKVTGAPDETYHVSQGDYASLVATGAANSASSAALEARVSSLETSVSTLQGQVSTLQAQVADLQTRMAAAEATIIDHENRLVAGGL